MTKSSCQRNKRKINDGDAPRVLLSLASHRDFSIRETVEPFKFINASVASGFGMTKRVPDSHSGRPVFGLTCQRHQAPTRRCICFSRLHFFFHASERYAPRASIAIAP